MQALLQDRGEAEACAETPKKRLDAMFSDCERYPWRQQAFVLQATFPRRLPAPTSKHSSLADKTM
jgi:hypothetical protein